MRNHRRDAREAKPSAESRAQVQDLGGGQVRLLGGTPYAGGGGRTTSPTVHTVRHTPDTVPADL